MFRALLLSVWYDLSEVTLSEALDDRASFRRFCGFAASEPTPERTAFVRCRRRLVAHGLDRSLFEEVTAQLKAKGGLAKAVEAIMVAHPGKRIELWFQDEARVGQKGRTGRRWWLRDKHPPSLCDERFASA